jgi:hypothetical protein
VSLSPNRQKSRLIEPSKHQSPATDSPADKNLLRAASGPQDRG